MLAINFLDFDDDHCMQTPGTKQDALNSFKTCVQSVWFLNKILNDNFEFSNRKMGMETTRYFI